MFGVFSAGQMHERGHVSATELRARVPDLSGCLQCQKRWELLHRLQVLSSQSSLSETSVGIERPLFWLGLGCLADDVRASGSYMYVF